MGQIRASHTGIYLFWIRREQGQRNKFWVLGSFGSENQIIRDINKICRGIIFISQTKTYSLYIYIYSLYIFVCNDPAENYIDLTAPSFHVKHSACAALTSGKIILPRVLVSILVETSNFTTWSPFSKNLWSLNDINLSNYSLK